MLQKGLIDFVRKLRSHESIRNICSQALVFVPLEINGNLRKVTSHPLFPLRRALPRKGETRKNKYFVLKAEIPCDPLGEHSISAFLTCTLSYNAYNATRYTKGRFLISTTLNTNDVFLFSFFFLFYFGIVDVLHTFA